MSEILLGLAKQYPPLLYVLLGYLIVRLEGVSKQVKVVQQQMLVHEKKVKKLDEGLEIVFNKVSEVTRNG